MNQKIKKNLVTFMQGLAVGTAEIIPGVSGSTIALLMGIYDDFIELLYLGTEIPKTFLLFLIGQKNKNDIIKSFTAIRWNFAIFLGLGMMIAILSLSSVITYLLLNQPQFLFAFLFGLIPPTFKVVYGQMRALSVANIGVSLITTVVFLFIFIFGSSATSFTNPHPAHLFIGGMVSISAMVLPGISGSFMLLVLGLYNFVVGLIAQLSMGTFSMTSLTQLLIFVSGIGIGLLTSVRVIKYAFQHFRDQLMSFLLGLLLSSWYVLWPFVKVVGESNHAPIMIKVWPWQLGSSALILAIIAGLTTIIVAYLQQYADLKDTSSPADDDGFDRL